jgi:hypothetical protein
VPRLSVSGEATCEADIDRSVVAILAAPRAEKALQGLGSQRNYLSIRERRASERRHPRARIGSFDRPP